MMVQWSRNHLRLSVTTRHAITLAVKRRTLVCTRWDRKRGGREGEKERKKGDKRFILWNLTRFYHLNHIHLAKCWSKRKKKKEKLKNAGNMMEWSKWKPTFLRWRMIWWSNNNRAAWVWVNFRLSKRDLNGSYYIRCR